MVADDHTAELLDRTPEGLALLAHSHTLGRKSLMHSPNHMTKLTGRLTELVASCASSGTLPSSVTLRALTTLVKLVPASREDMSFYVEHVLGHTMPAVKRALETAASVLVARPAPSRPQADDAVYLVMEITALLRDTVFSFTRPGPAGGDADPHRTARQSAVGPLFIKPLFELLAALLQEGRRFVLARFIIHTLVSLVVEHSQNAALLLSLHATCAFVFGQCLRDCGHPEIQLLLLRLLRLAGKAQPTSIHALHYAAFPVQASGLFLYDLCRTYSAKESIDRGIADAHLYKHINAINSSPQRSVGYIKGTLTFAWFDIALNTGYHVGRKGFSFYADEKLCVTNFPMPSTLVTIPWVDLECVGCFWVAAEQRYLLAATHRSAKARQSWSPGQDIRPYDILLSFDPLQYTHMRSLLPQELAAKVQAAFNGQAVPAYQPGAIFEPPEIPQDAQPAPDTRLGMAEYVQEWEYLGIGYRGNVDFKLSEEAAMEGTSLPFPDPFVPGPHWDENYLNREHVTAGFRHYVDRRKLGPKLRRRPYVIRLPDVYETGLRLNPYFSWAFWSRAFPLMPTEQVVNPYVTGDALGALSTAGIDLRDVEAGNESVPSGADLVRSYTCCTLAANTELFNMYGDRPRMSLYLSRAASTEGLPFVEGLSSLSLSDCFWRCGMLDAEQVYRAVVLKGTYDKSGKWAREESGIRSKPGAPRFAYHLTYASAEDRLPGYLMPGAHDTDVERHAAAISHGCNNKACLYATLNLGTELAVQASIGRLPFTPSGHHPWARRSRLSHIQAFPTNNDNFDYKDCSLFVASVRITRPQGHAQARAMVTGVRPCSFHGCDASDRRLVPGICCQPRVEHEGTIIW